MIEFLVALTVAALLLAATLTIVLSTQRTYAKDQDRTEVNQSLRSSLDLIGLEIRRAGERLPVDLPAVELVDGGGGSDTLILRRGRDIPALPLCQALVGGGSTSEIAVADGGASPPHGCVPLPDANADGYPDDVDAWRGARATAGGALWAYVFNPTSRLGEWFLYDGDGVAATALAKGNADTWVNDYALSEQCRLYLLDERRYSLNGGVLRFHVDQDSSNPVNVSAGITDLQARVVLEDGTVLDSFDGSIPWSRLAAVELTLVGAATSDGRTTTRSVSSRFLPRSVLVHR